MVTSSSEDKIMIINCLEELSCCSRCILRFLKVRNDVVSYKNAEAYLKALMDREHDGDVCVPPKRVKRNSCSVCLDILKDSTIKEFCDNIPLKEVDEYSHTDFTTNISLPKSLLIRNHSMYVYLKRKFPGIYSVPDGIEHLKNIFRSLSIHLISDKISKMFNPKSRFSLTVKILYEDNDLETENINKLIRKETGKKLKQQAGNNNIVDILNKCEDKAFTECFPVPPETPNKHTTVEFQCTAEPIWLGGRYLKFSRNMGQTPWIIDNKVLTEYNLQDVIFDSIQQILGYNKEQFTFCASGREDFDVRMLGNGRPFYVQINDPKDDRITFDQCRAIEIEVFKLKLAAIVKLQKIDRQSLKYIKIGEQTKKKQYRALCQIIGLNDVSDVVDTINKFKAPFEILQKTPMRVLHRRTQDVRKKIIYSMEANSVAGHSNLFEVLLTSQAGTYIKEFANGDFQRTRPSLSSILNHQIDIVALDVTNIDLAWPEQQE
ncbi:hypothetical protein NQ315_003735 [Exocentrus adspersus]|uniref:tRNA pseudouridine(55) synthase n=1 Tax=Exocentrus adspersus TaxID=1586481 RepID=A0AAV8VJ62_9CUCU|nr:hypothetical protein NQ315_003735 [Exocentrus adspersus]